MAGRTQERTDAGSAARLSDLMKRLMTLVTERSAGETLAVMTEAGITLPQMVTLHALRAFGAHSVSEISDRVRHSRAATSHLVDRLVQEGLVRREEAEHDRRHKRVEITAAGEALLDRLAQARVREFSEALAKVRPQARAQLERALAEVIEELEDYGHEQQRQQELGHG